VDAAMKTAGELTNRRYLDIYYGYLNIQNGISLSIFLSELFAL
jgi:hypothetical protein